MFNIMVKNESFISFCNYVDTSWLKYLIGTLVYVPSAYLLYLVMINEKLGKDWWVLLLALPISFVKDKVVWLGMILDMSIMILVPLLRLKGKCWKRVLVVHIIVFGYQLLMLLLRNLHLFFEGNNTTLVGLIMNIDYYILVCILYLYNTLKIIKER